MAAGLHAKSAAPIVSGEDDSQVEAAYKVQEDVLGQRDERSCEIVSSPNHRARLTTGEHVKIAE
jgi:hypothetical protein